MDKSSELKQDDKEPKFGHESDGGGNKRTRVPTNSERVKHIDISGSSASVTNAENEDYSSPSASPPRKQLIAALKDRLKEEDSRAKMALAHEIALNETFQLSHPAESPEQDPVLLDPEVVRKKQMEKAVKEVVRQAFWDCVRDGIESDPPRYEHAFILLQEIKEILLALLPQNRVTSIQKRIEEVVDMELFRQQAENDTLDVQSVASFVIDTMAAMCAPARDEEVAALRSTEDIVDLFQQMHGVLEKMKIDFANFAIKSVRPHIQHQQFEYERSAFAKLVQDSPDGLKKTRGWIFMTQEEIKADLDQLTESLNRAAKLSENESKTAEKSHQEVEKIRKSVLSPLSVLKTAYTKLLTWDYTKSDFPETLQMDKARYEALKLQVEHLVLVAAVMMTGCGVLGNPLASHRPFLSRLKDSLLVISSPEAAKNTDVEDLLSKMHLQVWKEAVHYVDGKGPEVEKCVSENKESIIESKTMLLSSKQSHPVYGILHKRAVEYLSSVAETLSQRTSVSSPSMPALPAGLSFLATEMLNVAHQYAKLVNLNQMVYGPFYVPILREILGLPKSPSNSSNPGEGTSPNGETKNGIPDVESKKQATKEGNSEDDKEEKKVTALKKVYKVTGSLDELD